MLAFVSHAASAGQVLCAPRAETKFYCSTIATRRINQPQSVDQNDVNAWRNSNEQWRNAAKTILGTPPILEKRTHGQYNDVYNLPRDMVNADGLFPLTYFYTDEELRDPLVVRITKCGDVRKRMSSGDRKCLYRRKEVVFKELALSLHMACIGVAPPIFAAFHWKESDDDAYGLCMIMGYGGSTGAQWRKVPELGHSPIIGEETRINNLVNEYVRVCERVSEEGYVNFDTKPDNFVTGKDKAFPLVKMLDFDATFFLKATGASHKSRVFCMLLLVTLHTIELDGVDGSNVRSPYVETFVLCIRDMLQHMWVSMNGKPHFREADDTRSDWLRNLAHADAGLKWKLVHPTGDEQAFLKTQLGMMLNNYFLGDEVKAARTGKFVRLQKPKGDVKLIPLLMRFIVYDGALESRFNALTPNAPRGWYSSIDKPALDASRVAEDTREKERQVQELKERDSARRLQTLHDLLPQP